MQIDPLDESKVSQIIASYEETGNYRETARRLGVSDSTVRKLRIWKRPVSILIGKLPA